MSAGGLLSLKWNNHCSTFLHILSNLHKKQTYHDATVACGGLLYPVHKMVLSTCSEYFEEMFDSIHDKHPIIVLKDIKGEVFEALLKYMYIGEVNVIQDRLSDLISAAECLKIKGLAVPDEEPSDNKSSRHSRSSSSSAAKRRHEQMSDSGVTSLPPSKVQRSNSNNSYNNRNVNNVQSYASSNVMSRSQPVVDKSKPAECSREARDGSSYRSRKHSDDDIEEIQPEIKQEPRDVSAGEEEDMADDGTEQQTMRDGSSSHDNSERKHLSHQDRGAEPGRTEKSARNMSGGEEEELSKQEMVEEEDESNVSEHWGGNDGDEEGDTFGFLGGDSNSGAGGTDGDTTHHHQQDNEEDDNNDGVWRGNAGMLDEGNTLLVERPHNYRHHQQASQKTRVSDVDTLDNFSEDLTEFNDAISTSSPIPSINQNDSKVQRRFQSPPLHSSSIRQNPHSKHPLQDEHCFPSNDSLRAGANGSRQSFARASRKVRNSSAASEGVTKCVSESAITSLLYSGVEELGSPPYNSASSNFTALIDSAVSSSPFSGGSTRYTGSMNSSGVAVAGGDCGSLYNSQIYYCPHCKYTTTIKHNLDRHMRRHTGEKPFGCPYCSYRATTKQNVTTHMSFKHCDKDLQPSLVLIFHGDGGSYPPNTGGGGASDNSA